MTENEKSKEDILLQWKNFNVKSKSDNREILSEITGELRSGQSLAILGGSGAGKTTFLNYLSQRQGKEGLKRVSGEIKVIINNKDMTKSFDRLTAYVTQDDLLQSYLTPFELFKFAADLKLPNKSNEEKLSIINKLISDLKLEKCKDTLVGNVESKGLSGGERKRTAIGYELITNPKILFLDEPTTGLDIVSAKNIVEIITNEAKINNRIVIFTIHQPSSEIFHIFDKLMIIGLGKNIYFGNSNECLSFFSKFNYNCDKNTNPAEFVITMTSIKNYISTKNSQDLKNINESIDIDEEELVYEEEFKSLLENMSKSNTNDLRLTQLPEDYSNDYKINLISSNDFTPIEIDLHSKISFLTELLILLGRNLKALKRDPNIFFSRLGMTIVNALFVLGIYFNLGKGDNAYYDRQSCLFFITNITVSANMQLNLLILINEKVYFYKETDNKIYGTNSYLISKLLIEIPLQMLFAILIAIIVYFLCGFNLNSSLKVFEFCFVLFLSGLCSALFSYFLSAIVNSIELAPSILPPFIFTQALAGGFYIKFQSIPKYFYPFYYLSIYRYTYQSFIHIEFTDMSDLECKDPLKCVNPLNDITDSYQLSLLCLGLYTLACYLLTLFVINLKAFLRKRANKK